MRPKLDVKKVWGIVLIVIGVLAVFGGANQYREIEAIEDGIKVMNAEFKRYSGKHGILDSDIYDAHGLVEKGKTQSIMSMTVGVLLSIFGTFMIRKKPEPEPVFIESTEHEVAEEPRFKF